MSKKLFIINFSLLIFLFCSYGQQGDSRSREIIDNMTARFKTYPGLALNFSLIITQLQDESETKHEGKIWIKSNKFKLEIFDFVMFSDGSNIYQYLPDVNEAYKTKPDPSENDGDFQLFNPQTYFNFSSNAFRSNLLRETTQNNRSVYEIDLIPFDVLKSDYSRIRVMVERSTLQLVNLRVSMKDGTNYTLAFNPYNIQPALSDSFFTFNPSEYPNVEVVDLTF